MQKPRFDEFVKLGDICSNYKEISAFMIRVDSTRKWNTFYQINLISALPSLKTCNFAG
jgi:hypothetical protein